MAQTILGIDIGSYSVKVCRLTRYLRDFELVNYYEQPINQSHRLTHEEALSAALRSLVEKNELSGDIVAASIPSHLLSCRVLELPFTNVKKIEQTIEFELESYLPLSIDEMLVDYHILSIGESRSTILTAYVPRARFIKYLDILQVAGLEPKFFGVDCIDLSHIAHISMVPQEAVYALLDIGHQKTNICIMKGMDLLYSRSIPIGGSSFTKAIQKAFRLSYDKAEALKIDRGRVSLQDDKLDQISRQCLEVSQELLVAIRQTYMGFKQIYHQEDWSALFVTGGGARLPGLLDVLSASLRINVSTLDCLDFISHKIGQPEMCRGLIAPALSQAMRVVFSNKAIKINFRRGEFAYKKDIKALGTEMKQLSGWIAAMMILGCCHFGFSYYTYESRIEAANQGLVDAAVKELPELKKEVKKRKSVEAKTLVKLLNNKVSEIKPQLDALQANNSGLTALGALLEVSKLMPSKEDVQVDIDLFSYQEDFFKLEGRTVSFEAIDKIKQSVSQSKLLKNVNADPSPGIRDEKKFKLTADIVQETQEAEEG